MITVKSIARCIAVAAVAIPSLLASCRHDSDTRLDISLPDKYEGKTVEIISFSDSTIVAKAVVTDGKAVICDSTLVPGAFSSSPLFTQVMIDGRVRAYYVMEPGHALLTDSMSVASGTPLNDRFASMMQRLDSVDALDDMSIYLDFTEKEYNANKDNVLGQFFGVEWLKYAEPAAIDSLVAVAPADLTGSVRARHYIEFARLRAATSPGCRYIDFEGEDADGNPLSLAGFVRPGRYTLVDFWASWCPYCIKELPQLAELRDTWGPKGLDIVGVAVRDKTEDTKSAVERYNIAWDVLYNTQRRPYDIYGFSGIPHHILIGPDGTIISRGESAAQIAQRLEKLLASER